MTNPDNLDPWQRVAIELGTWDWGVGFCDEPATWDERYGGDGEWTKTEPACRLIAELRAEVERLRADNQSMDARIRGDHD